MNKVELCNFENTFKDYNKILEFTVELRELLIKYNIKKIEPYISRPTIELTIKGIEISGWKFSKID